MNTEADPQPQRTERRNKRQHFIPQLHLKHFVGDNPRGQVWTYDALKGTARSATPENTALQSYFYSIETEDGAIDSTVDDFITENEGHAAPVYEALLRSEFPATGSRAHQEFAVFLAMMHLRTPAMRRMSAEIYGRGLQILSYASAQHPHSFSDIIREIEQEEGKPLDKKTKQRVRQTLIDPSGMVIGVPKESTFPVLAAVKDLASVFLNMKWSLLTAAHGFFITTDNPLVREVDPKSISPSYGDGGFYNKTAEIIFPLSPTKLLFMSWGLFRPHREAMLP